MFARFAHICHICSWVSEVMRFKLKGCISRHTLSSS